MKQLFALIEVGVATLVLAVAGCSERDKSEGDVAGVRQTRAPGQVTSGGGTSGEVLARSQSVREGSYAGGTPYIAGGSGGTTGGAATAGTVQESGQGPSHGTSAPGSGAAASAAAPASTAAAPTSTAPGGTAPPASTQAPPARNR